MPTITPTITVSGTHTLHLDLTAYVTATRQCGEDSDVEVVVWKLNGKEYDAGNKGETDLMSDLAQMAIDAVELEEG